jgi:Nif11 domain
MYFLVDGYHKHRRETFMSLEHVNAFYEALTQDNGIYEQYYNKCCSRGFFGIWNWDKTKIVNFAATLGFTFNETELDQVWFEGEPDVTNNSLNISEYSHASSSVMGK